MIVTKIKRYTPVTGATINMENSDGDMVVILAPATTIATLVLNWPSIPFDGQRITVMATNDVTAITHTGGTINKNITSIKASGSFEFIYDFGGSNYMLNSDNADLMATSGTVSDLATRVTSLEAWRADKATYLGTAIAADLTTNYNTVTTLLGVLTSALNTTNTKVNALITRVGTMQSGLQTREIFASS